MAHITVCPDLERSQLYKNSVDAVESWMESHDTDPMLAKLIDAYLRAQGTKV